MTAPPLDVVTGAYGFIGRHIAVRLLEQGRGVRTLTGHLDRPDPFNGQVPAFPYAFADPDALARSLEGVDTLYNTYWVRFERGTTTFEQAVRNSQAIIQAARTAGVRRLVHVSITKASADSPLPYYSGKARVEQAIQDSGLSHAILRPNVVFGDQGLLIHNIAWILRTFPVFAIPGHGQYRVQPVYVEDLAELAVRAGAGNGAFAFDAVGPEIYTFEDLVRTIAARLGLHARLVHLPPRLAWCLSGAVGCLVRDRVLTWPEVQGLMADLLVSETPPTGWTRLSAWLEQERDMVGARYVSEFVLHYRTEGDTTLASCWRGTAVTRSPSE